jgi:hypothetical protein
MDRHARAASPPKKALQPLNKTAPRSSDDPGLDRLASIILLGRNWPRARTVANQPALKKAKIAAAWQDHR